MPIYALGDLVPEIDREAFVHPMATVIGAVRIGPDSSIWPGAVLRGDYGRIEVGRATSIQDGSVVHATAAWPTRIGSNCVVGHLAHLEGCTVGDSSLIGSGSIVLARAIVEAGSAVGAASLVAEGKVVPSGQLAVGVPARLRPMGTSTSWLDEAVAAYCNNARRYRAELRQIE